jgi:hypothetical protein
MLTTNQTLLLRRIANAPEPISVEALSSVRNEHDDEMGENAVRSSTKRMEKNGWVTGSGIGRLRSYAITAVGVAALQDPTASDSSLDNGDQGAPAPPGLELDASPASSRNYVVLEEVMVGELELDEQAAVYVVVETTAARNVEAALRHAAKANFEDGIPRLVAVSEKMWQVTPVEVKTARSVSIGGG